MTYSSVGFRLGLALIITGFAFGAIGIATAMPQISADLGFRSWYSWAFTTFTVGQVLGTVIGGRLCDRRGAVGVVLAGIALFTVATVVAAASWDASSMLACRFLQGLGAGIAFNGHYVLVARVLFGRDRAVMMAWVSGAWVLPGVVGPLVAGTLTELWSWRLTFGIIVPLVLVGVAASWRYLMWARRQGDDRGEPAASGSKLPVWAAVTAATSIAAIQLGLQLRAWPWLVLAGLAAFALIVAWLRLLPAPDAHPALRWVVGARAGSAGGFFGAEAYMPLMLVTLAGLSLAEGGLILTAGSIAWAAAAQWQSRASFPWTRTGAILAGALMVCLGVVFIVIWTMVHLPAWLVVVAWLPMAFGMGLSYMGVSLEVMAVSRSHELGRNTSSLQLSENLGVALSTGLVGVVFSAVDAWGPRGQFGAALVVATLVTMFAVVSAWRVRRLDSEPADEIH